MAVSKCVNQIEIDFEYCLLVFPRKKEDWWFIKTKTHLLYFYTLIVYICLKSKICLLLMCAFKEMRCFFCFVLFLFLRHLSSGEIKRMLCFVSL